MREGGERNTEVFTQEIDNTNQIEYRKETSPLTTKSSKEASSAPTKATKLNLKGSNSTIYSDHREHEMATPQVKYLGFVFGKDGILMDPTPNAPDQQNMYKSTGGSFNKDIVNITSSDNDKSER